MRTKLLIVVALLMLCFVGSAQADIDIHTWPLQTLLQSDMGLDEQIPEGVPGYYDWYSKAVVHYVSPAAGYNYLNPWGVIYNVRSGNAYPLDRVEVRDLQEWVFSKSAAQWVPLYPAPPTLGGALFPEAFNGANICGRYANTGDGGILISPNIACGGVQVSGYTWHFYPSVSRAYLSDPTDVEAVAVQARVRLATTNPASDDPGYIASVGSDFWTSPAGSTFHGSGQSRFVTVKHDWRTVTYITVPATQLAALPPISVDPNELF